MYALHCDRPESAPPHRHPGSANQQFCFPFVTPLGAQDDYIFSHDIILQISIVQIPLFHTPLAVRFTGPVGGYSVSAMRPAYLPAFHRSPLQSDAGLYQRPCSFVCIRWNQNPIYRGPVASPRLFNSARRSTLNPVAERWIAGTLSYAIITATFGNGLAQLGE